MGPGKHFLGYQPRNQLVDKETPALIYRAKEMNETRGTVDM